GGLVQSPVSQNKFRQRTAPDVLGFGTRPTDLVVPAVMEMPVALELRTTGTAIQAALDTAPRRPPVLLHVAIGYVVRDALIADRGHQPVKYRTGISVTDRRSDLVGTEVCSDLLDQVCRACQATNGMDQPDRMVEGRTLPALNFWVVSLGGRTTRDCGRGRRHHSGSNHRNELALRIGVAVDVPLRGLDRAVTGQQLNVAQRAACLVDDASGPGDEGSSPRMRRAAF